MGGSVKVESGPGLSQPILAPKSEYYTSSCQKSVSYLYRSIPYVRVPMKAVVQMHHQHF